MSWYHYMRRNLAVRQRDSKILYCAGFRAPKLEENIPQPLTGHKVLEQVGEVLSTWYPLSSSWGNRSITWMRFRNYTRLNMDSSTLLPRGTATVFLICSRKVWHDSVPNNIWHIALCRFEHQHTKFCCNCVQLINNKVTCRYQPELWKSLTGQPQRLLISNPSSSESSTWPPRNLVWHGANQNLVPIYMLYHQRISGLWIMTQSPVPQTWPWKQLGSPDFSLVNWSKSYLASYSLRYTRGRARNR